jgi:hypothetical protein
MGRACSEETKRKIREAQIGRKFSDEQRRHMSEARKGMKFSAEHLKHMREAAFRRPPMSDETRRKLSMANRGQVVSEEKRQKLRAALIGRKLPEDQKKKIRDACRGEKHYHWIPGVPRHITTLHQRMWRMYGKADHCENPQCAGKSNRYEWSNKRHDYKTLKREDWQQLCKLCHENYDINHNKKRKSHAKH